MSENFRKLRNLDTVIVILQPYTNCPDESHERAIRLTKHFRDRGRLVFSPILHTHNYHVSLREENPDHDDDYYNWDLGVYAAMKDNIYMVFTHDWETSKGCRLEMEWAKKNGIPTAVMERDDKLVPQKSSPLVDEIEKLKEKLRKSHPACPECGCCDPDDYNHEDGWCGQCGWHENE